MFSRWLDADGRVSASLGTSDVQISGKTSVARKHGESVRQQTVTQIGQREAQAIRDPHGYVDSRWKRHHSAIPDREPGDLHREAEGNTDNDPLRSSEPKQKKRRQPRTQRDETVANRGRTVSKGYQTRVRNLLFRRQKSEVSFRSMSRGFQMVGRRGSAQEKSPLRISRSG